MADSIMDILEKYRTLAVVGLSSKPSRPSYGVSAYMLSQGYRIIPVNPNEESVLGQKACPSLDEVRELVEVVVIFRRSEYVPEIVESAIRKQAKVVWMQEGVINQKAANNAQQVGLTVIMDRCMKKEHERIVGEATST